MDVWTLALVATLVLLLITPTAALCLWWSVRELRSCGLAPLPKPSREPARRTPPPTPDLVAVQQAWRALEAERVVPAEGPVTPTLSQGRQVAVTPGPAVPHRARTPSNAISGPSAATPAHDLVRLVRDAGRASAKPRTPRRPPVIRRASKR